MKTMHYEFTASSMGRFLALYDPGAISEDFPFDPDTETLEPKMPSKESLRQLAESHAALIFEFANDVDSEATIQVVVDQPLPSDPGKPRKQFLRQSRLRIPSGHLTFDGAEFIHPKPKARKHSDGTVEVIPSGMYELEVVNQIPWKTANRDAYVVSKTTSLARVLSKLFSYIALSWGIFIFSTVFIVPVIVLVLWMENGLMAGLMTIAVVMAIHLICFCIFLSTDAVTKRWPKISGVAEARRSFDQENPDILVSLRLVSDVMEVGNPSYLKLKSSR